MGGAWGEAVNGGFWDANDASAQSTILSGQSTADWLRVDLGAEYVINQIVYDNRYYNTQQVGVTTIYQQTFDIQVSTNGTTWTTVASRSGQTTAQKYVLAITPVTARYVRVTNVLSQFTANSNWHYVYATELQVYSTATWGGAVTPIKHYYLGGRRVATRDADGLKYLHADHLGSTGRLSNASGVPVRSVWYDPWGKVAADTSGVALAYKFTGQEQDGTGLYDYGARAYDPILGRFLSADTIVPDFSNPQSLNRYSYVLGNPLKFVDPTGHYSDEEILGFFQEWFQFGIADWEAVLWQFREGALAGRWGWLDVLRQAQDGDYIGFLGFSSNGRACQLNDGPVWGRFSREGGFHIQGTNLQNVVDAGRQGSVYHTKGPVYDPLQEHYREGNIYTSSYQHEPPALNIKFSPKHIDPGAAILNVGAAGLDILALTVWKSPAAQSPAAMILELKNYNDRMGAARSGGQLARDPTMENLWGTAVSAAGAGPAWSSLVVNVGEFFGHTGLYFSP